MKEKLKNIFKNENLWSTIVEILCAVLLVCVGYFSGFSTGLLVDDSIRTEIIDNTLNDSKKSKIEPNKANDIVKYSPLDTIGEITKVYFWINEDVVYDFYRSINGVEFDFDYYVYSNLDGSIYLDIIFPDEQAEDEFFIFDLKINDTFLFFRFEQNQVFDLDFSDNLPIDDSMFFDDLLNYTGGYISNNHDLLGLNDYYYNNTEASYDLIENEDFTRLYVYTYDIQADKNFINYLIDGAGTLISLFGGLLVSAVLSITGVFYSNGKLTIIGAAMAFALVVGIVYLVFRMVRGLVKSNNRG